MIPITWDLYRRMKKKDPAGRRTWWFDVVIPGQHPNCISFYGTFPEVCEAVQQHAKRFRGAKEIVVLLP